MSHLTGVTVALRNKRSLAICSTMSKRKVTFEDGNGELDLDDDVPNKKVILSRSHHIAY